MQPGCHDISDCLDCPLLAGLTVEQKLERIRTDPLIARRLGKRALAPIPVVTRKKRRKIAASIDDLQGACTTLD